MIPDGREVEDGDRRLDGSPSATAGLI